MPCLLIRIASGKPVWTSEWQKLEIFPFVINSSFILQSAHQTGTRSTDPGSAHETPRKHKTRLSTIWYLSQSPSCRRGDSCRASIILFACRPCVILQFIQVSPETCIQRFCILRQCIYRVQRMPFMSAHFTNPRPISAAIYIFHQNVASVF